MKPNKAYRVDKDTEGSLRSTSVFLSIYVGSALFGFGDSSKWDDGVI